MCLPHLQAMFHMHALRFHMHTVMHIKIKRLGSGIMCASAGGSSSSSTKRSRVANSHKTSKKPRLEQNECEGPRTLDYYCSACFPCVMQTVVSKCFQHVFSLGIDLATAYDKRDTVGDLDHIILDSLLEGFDTGVSCLKMYVHLHCSWA